MCRVEGGVGYADAPAHIVATIGTRHVERDGWRFNSFAKGIDGN